ncbi:MAG: ATP-binding protein [Acidobacteria bacterium]|nr:ATP-binding protein [Acidobacteriota bacterium]
MDILAKRGPSGALAGVLQEWCAGSPRPICLVIDEIDAMVGDSLVSVLRQLRSGYELRPKRFPQSVVLCGVRDVRDYRLHSGGEIITGGSAFNIKAESLTIGNFSPNEIRRLYEQHTAETGQRFEDDVYPYVWELTRGQPWLVNALANEACFKIEADRSRPVTRDLIYQAKENLILQRVTHLDQLADKLKEPRVRRVIEPMVQSSDSTGAMLANDDDAQYTIDLGLVRRGPAGLEVANGIYAEVIPRALNAQMQMNFEPLQRTEWYLDGSGRLDMSKLLEAFQQFFRENSEAWLNGYEYPEAGPQLLLQAFLQRLVNGGGRIDREYGLGRRRTDLLIQWPYPGGVQRVVIELKMVRGSPERTISEGLQQVEAYMDAVGPSEAHLFLFDRRPGVSWQDRIFRRQASTAIGRAVTVWGA